MSPTTIILPHTIPERSRKKKFDSDMELSAIVCLALAKSRTAERIAFIAKLHYPLWAVPWENDCLIIDALQTLSSTITYMTLPNIETFVNDLERGQVSREQFQKALEKHTHTFEGFSKSEVFQTKAVVATKALLSEISEYVKENHDLEPSVPSSLVLIPPKLSKALAEESKKGILNVYDWIQFDIKSLEHLANISNEITQFHADKILHEIELANEAFKEKIEKIQPDVDKKVELLLKERDANIEKTEKETEGELKTLFRERDKLQRELEKLEIDRAEYREKLDARKGRRRKTGVARWGHRLRACENNISLVRQAIHSLSGRIERRRRRTQEDVNKLKYDYQASIDFERKKITEVRISREYMIKAKENESRKLRAVTNEIVGLITQLKEQKKLQATELKSLTIPWQSGETSLLCVPFYFVGYKTGNKFFYSLFPPLKALSPEGIVKKIKKALLSFSLRSRMKLLLQPRSKELGKMFDLVVEGKLGSENDFKEMMRTLGSSNNLLSIANFQEVLSKGLEELKAEGWIKPEEVAVVMKADAQDRFL